MASQTYGKTLKRYLHDASIPIPRTTAWRWKKGKNNNDVPGPSHDLECAQNEDFTSNVQQFGDIDDDAFEDSDDDAFEDSDDDDFDDSDDYTMDTTFSPEISSDASANGLQVNSPAENSPAANSSAENSPAANSPSENSPAANSPAENSPAANSSAENSPAANSSAENSSAANSNYWGDLNKPISNGVETTIAEVVLLLMNFVLQYNLPWVAMQNLFCIFNLIIGQHILPASKYLETKIFGGMNAGFIFHLYCPDCQNYLTKYVERVPKMNLECSNCQKMCNSRRLVALGNFFVTLPIADQLRDLLNSKTVASALEKNIDNIQCRSETRVRDITDGELYRKKREQLCCSKYDLTLTVNTDGSPVFKSSKSSMWPIQFVLNELPPQLRWKNVVVSGLWFGQKHPNMTMFLNTFVEEMAILSETPITWTSSSQAHKSKVFVLCFCADSPARAAAQNTTQYNGYYGCSWCLHPGSTLDGNSQVKYLINYDNFPKDRTEKGMAKDMRAALRQGYSVNGVKGPSPLLNLPGFDIVWGFSTEYMHSLLLGVSRQFTQSFLTSVNELWYVGLPATQRLIDFRLLKIKTPHLLTRLPRSIASRKYWKASEWKNWLLYYSVPCLSGILNNKFLKHWLLLVEASFLILKDVVTWGDINRIDLCLSEFVIRTQILYGETAMTSNVHQLLHYAKSIKLLGPAWSRSAFVFENSNGALLNLVTAANGAPLQVLNRYMFKKRLSAIVNDLHDTLSERVQLALRDIHSYKLVKNFIKVQQCNLTFYLFGKCNDVLSDSEREILSLHTTDLDNVFIYSKLLVVDSAYKSIYHSEKYTRPQKTNNTVICARDNRYFFIKKFILYNESKNCRCLCQELIVENRPMLPPHMRKCEYPPDGMNLHFLLVDEIKRICVFVDVGNDRYVCDIPNIYERD